jgi:dienelactone hydrolase
VLAAAAAWPAHALPEPARVTFASHDPGVTVTALYFRPPGAGRVPLVIALHGCGGMYRENTARGDRLTARSLAWTEALVADGYAVLWPDSFNPRGRRSVCLVKRGEPTVTPVTRSLDVLAALDYAATRGDVDRARTAIVGWSHGGSTTLAAVNGRDPHVALAFRDAPRPLAAVAFYPGCVVSLRKRDGWLPAVPLRIDAAELDDWTPPAACVTLGERARAAGADMTVTVYPDAHHGFDAPGGEVRVWREVTTGATPDKGVTVGPNPAARAAADRAVRGFLRERLQ